MSRSPTDHLSDRLAIKRCQLVDGFGEALPAQRTKPVLRVAVNKPSCRQDHLESGNGIGGQRQVALGPPCARFVGSIEHDD